MGNESVTEETWVDDRGIEQKRGAATTYGYKVLQKCQKCGRWVYTLTDMKEDGHVCGHCVRRILDKRWRARRK